MFSLFIALQQARGDGYIVGACEDLRFEQDDRLQVYWDVGEIRKGANQNLLLFI